MLGVPRFHCIIKSDKSRSVSRDRPQAVRNPFGEVGDHPPGRAAESAIGLRGLLGMMPMTEGLPVVSGPEELLITVVRNDVVDVVCGLAALNTVGMRAEEAGPCLLPGCAISALASAWARAIGRCLSTLPANAGLAVGDLQAA